MKPNLRGLLKARGKSQVWLAERIDVSTGYLSEIVAGKKMPSSRKLHEIAEALAVSVDDLYRQEVDAQTPRAPGFSEPASSVFIAADQTAAQKTDDITYQTTAFTARIDLPGFSILKGDTILATNGTPNGTHDQLVLATLSDPASGEAETHVMRSCGDWLLHSDPAKAPVKTNTQDGHAAIMGEVTGIIRNILGRHG